MLTAGVEILAILLASFSCFLCSMVVYNHNTESGVQLDLIFDLGRKSSPNLAMRAVVSQCWTAFHAMSLTSLRMSGEALKNGIPLGTCLNVNIPYKMDTLKGIKVCRQASAYWEDRFDKRLDQFNRTYYWLTGDFKDQQGEADTDVYWIDKGYATVVPTQFDLTAYAVIEKIENWSL